MTEMPLSNLAKELKIACDARDWKQLELLDKRVRETIEQLIVKTNGEADARVIAYLKSFQAIYQLMIADSELHRDEIASELQKLTKDQKVVNAYLDSSLL